MKEIKNVKEQVFFTYEAIDGTTFEIKEECEKYESTCKCVLMAKYNQIPKVSCSEYDITKYLGSEEYIFDIIKLRNDNDIDIIIQLFKLKYGNSYQDEIFNSVYTTLQKHKELGSHILIERGNEYEGFYLSPSIKTLEEIISNINSIIEKFN
jgi:hypothetical protein